MTLSESLHMLYQTNAEKTLKEESGNCAVSNKNPSGIIVVHES